MSEKVDLNMTLGQAKEIMREKMKKGGGKCLCCRQNVKMYKRPMTSAMAYALILIFKAPSHLKYNGYLHIENYFKDIPDLPASIRADVPKLRFWSLIEPKPGDTEDGNPNNGMYRITESGKLFVQMNGVVPSHVQLYNNRFFGFPDGCKQININEALKNKFNYLSLMKGELLAC